MGVSTEKRFKTKGMNSIYNCGATKATVGPGSYQNVEGGMIKKSYNMSVEHSYFV